MSDNEARERRRNKLLASREDRMSKIMSSMSSNSASSEQEIKADSPSPSETAKKPVESKPAPIKPSSPKKQQQPKKVEEMPAKALTQTKETNSKQQQNVVCTKPSRFVHVLVIILAAFTVLALNILSGFNECKLRIGADLCNAIQNSGYATMISVFCVVEAEEFLFGRLSNAAGSPVDAALLAKDLVLYFFFLLIALQLQSVFNL